MKSPVTPYRFLAALFLLATFGAFSSVLAQDEYANIKSWESFNFRGQSIASKDLNALTLYDLKLVRGIVFGKHGRIFKDPDIKRYLQSRDWYKPDAEFKNSSLNDSE